MYEKCLTVYTNTAAGPKLNAEFIAATVAFGGFNVTTGKKLNTWGLPVEAPALAIVTNEPVICAEVCRNNDFKYMALSSNDGGAPVQGNMCFCTNGLSEATFVKVP